ncbi:glutamine--fructose-6-phosphate transaminase (isomerizing) [Phaeodactylibacter luteus]|uniref:Glutamine--fructose-6-phosphate aminotransferase [isomerizing] n=1 Tax=Phaeodactylibacter luteus TaxID=1564516 RepID=A0A5C6S0J8_9BACT|nr:glutamine--fructose-6-phosphate transaminase (isomerizing) [Phaeodactylibacter luteus]TXB67924.1 glutamine--fructose-6-phosphate transaminase (isomerizing) [Phaeodactylibacter luteus]
MCGIVAYIGPRQACPILINGLKLLEYRGYDSAGIALMNGELSVYKRKGKVSELEGFIEGQKQESTVGIGHTRWATHGEPDDINAHPHRSGNGRLVMVHNGIIENYSPLKSALEKEGHIFHSQTDTEVLVHLIEEIQQQGDLPLEEAVRIALGRVVGAYAIVLMDKNDPDKLVAARKASPLVIGVGEDEYFLASDATPLAGHTKRVIYMNDEEIAVVHRNGDLQIKTISNRVQTPFVQELDMKIEELEKSGYEHFMLKEIHQQPETVADCMRGRLSHESPYIRLGGVEEYDKTITNARRFIIAACGTSWHAGLIGEYLFEDLARIPVEVEYASELRYRNPIIQEGDVVIALSQSGETADTLAALEMAKAKGAMIYGVVNVVGSSISRLTDAGSYIHAGPEIGVASTKAFTGQVVLLTMMAISLGYKRGRIPNSYFHKLITELQNIPGKIEKVLQHEEQIKYIANEIKDRHNALYLGRGFNFPVALEGALKLKEISYIHAEGYPAAEMKHGPIALIDEEMPVIVIATNKSAYEKIVSNIQEVKARKGMVIAVVTEGDEAISKMADYTIEIPDTEEPLTPLLSVIPLQLLSYHIAVMRGCNVDQPRNLAKSVTVE